ncbi:hypothetical protein, partial [Sphingomonas sp.]|uniref:hypothetical protein n=1 Tax=Sphingomonas sp. TaxID=28214 RepID=UPI002DBB4DB1
QPRGRRSAAQRGEFLNIAPKSSGAPERPALERLEVRVRGEEPEASLRAHGNADHAPVGLDHETV